MATAPVLTGCAPAESGSDTCHRGCAGASGTAGNPTSGGGSGGDSAGSGGDGAGSAGATTAGAPSGSGGAPGGSSGAAGMTTAGTAGTSAGAGSGGSAGAPDEKPPATLLGDVTFSQPSQAFEGQLSVELGTTVVDARIRYTTDRSLPTAASTLYAGSPVVIAATTELRAQAFVADAASGAASTALYVQRTFDATSDVPLVILDGYGLGEPADKEVWADAAIMIFEPSAGVAKLSNLPTLAARAGHHIHGSSSATFPQKPYRIELRDNAGLDLDYPVLGMPSDSDWVLIAPYYDRALVRNAFVYDLGRDMGLSAPRTSRVELYVNHEDRALEASDYAGVYYVTETIKNQKDRTQLKQLTEADTVLPAISGGYIMKFDWAVAESPTLTCTGSPVAGSGDGTCWDDLEVVDPSPLGPEQAAWLTTYVQAFHDSLHTTPVGDYASAIDLPSFVDNFIVNELTKNLDEFTRSAYYNKDRDGKLKAGPLWDYNFALGCGRPNNMSPESWQYPEAASEPGHMRRGASDWYPRLVTDPAFMAAVAARWQSLRQGLLSDAALDQRITALAMPLTAAAARDSERWPVSSVFGGGQSYEGPTATTWTGQVQAIRDWLPKRTAWMDAQLK